MKVLVVDDHPIVRAGLRRLLAVEPQIEVSEAATGNEALAIVKDNPPDLVVLDLNLPGIGGLKVIGRLKSENAAVRILVLSMHDNPIYVTHALQAGAAGYVSKSAPPKQILEAIGRVARGHTYIEPHMAQKLALSTIHPSAHSLKDLSRRELEILRLLGEGRSLPQIAETLGIGYKTIANNSSQIKAKLGAARTADLVRIAIQHGITADR
jgi:two-component system, NarL family, invasion response regulator UvrY